MLFGTNEVVNAIQVGLYSQHLQLLFVFVEFQLEFVEKEVSIVFLRVTEYFESNA